jgi:hypothetical protein
MDTLDLLPLTPTALTTQTLTHPGTIAKTEIAIGEVGLEIRTCNLGS